MNDISMVRFGVELLRCGDNLPFLEEFLREIPILDRFSVDLRTDEVLAFSACNECNRFAVRSGLLGSVAANFKKAVACEEQKFVGVFVQAADKGCDSVQVKNAPIETIHYAAMMQTPPGLNEIYNVWKFRPEIVKYLSPECKEGILAELGKMFCVLSSGILDTVITSEIINNIFQMYARGSNFNDVTEHIQSVLALCESCDVKINDSRLFEYALVQCFGGESDGEAGSTETCR